MLKYWLTTVGGIMSGFLLIPTALGSAHVAMPGWLYLTCIVVGTLGPVVIGVAAKGQDEHSTVSQVESSTQKADAAAKAAVNEQPLSK